MTKFAFPIRILGVIGFAILLIVALAAPMRALAAHLFQEPTPRPTATVAPTPTRTPSPTLTPSPTPTPFLEVEPTTVAGRQVVTFTVRGFSWPTGGAGVILAWDVFEEEYELVDEPIPVDPDGTFEEEIEVPKAWAIPGEHRIIAGNEQGFTTDVIVILTEPTPTRTPTPITPTPTTSPTPTSTPSPTLAPITPMVTITPQPVTPRPTRRPTRTSTPTPRPGTNTATPTPSITPTVTDTPGPGTPSVTPEPTSTITPTSTPVDEISDTGVGWGPIFLWGFVLAGLVIVFRLLRVRNLQGEG